ncbi:MAG: Coenzyme F420 hydrogenase/dehydrogenase, beta subunit C-terminal domain [Actinomycetota bacterium]
MIAGPRIRSINDVAEKHLCTGCGVCAFLQPDDIAMVDDLDRGRRPIMRPGRENADTAFALSACPGVGLEHGPMPDGAIGSLVEGWGPVLALWEGAAAADDLRYAGSSGGAASALALHGLEHGGAAGVLHIGARDDIPWLNHTRLSTTRDELMATTGSRYAPASPCDGLDLVESAEGACVMIGKPCDVAATRAAMALKPELADKVMVTIGIFCAGAPSTNGSLAWAKKVIGAEPDDITSLRYRGNGWPGHAVVEIRRKGEVLAERAASASETSASETSASETSASETYAESWGFLQAHRQWRCYVCADHTGEFADISVGDPWYRPTDGDPGRSLVMARTERGRRFIEEAIASGALDLEPCGSEILPASQPNLLETRGATWGRITALRAVGVATPRYRNMATASLWRSELTMKARAQSFYGTLKRAWTKKLYRRRPVEPYEPVSS